MRLVLLGGASNSGKTTVAAKLALASGGRIKVNMTTIESSFEMWHHSV